MSSFDVSLKSLCQNYLESWNTTTTLSFVSLGYADADIVNDGVIHLAGEMFVDDIVTCKSIAHERDGVCVSFTICQNVDVVAVYSTLAIATTHFMRMRTIRDSAGFAYPPPD